MTGQITARDGTPISRFAFGAMQFGGTADAEASAAMFAACRTAGITHFDTAHGYTQGRSEEILGRLAAPDRDSLIIASKVAYDGGAGRRNMSDQLDISLERLDMDRVDILYLHRFDPETDLRDTMETFAFLKEEGLIRYVGLSNFAAWQVVRAAWAASEFGLTIDILQPMYNLVKRQAEVEILPMCQALGIAVAPYSPLGGGLLTGKYGAGDAGRLKTDPRYAARYGPGWMHQTAQDLNDLAADIGQHPATLAVAWAARHPAQPSPILSARSVEQLAPSLAALRFDMDDDLYARISALSPTPAPATDRLEEA